MKLLYTGGLCAAAVISLNMAAFAQTTAGEPQGGTAAPKPQSGTAAPQTPGPAAAPQTAGDQQVTVTGCIQREADYRRAQDAGKGGVAGTGVGAGNEFVLANASMGGGAAAGTPTGTSGANVAYELTGTNEGQAEKLVGQRVEIAGKLKAAEVTAAGRATGGATAGKPPEGVDVTSQDLQLRELEIGSIKPVAGACAGQ